MDARIRLEPTAALVIDLGMKLFAADALTRRYVEQLDLSSAKDLLEDNKASGVYGLACESMCNRKFTVRHALFNALEAEPAPAQVLLLAAGKSPLGLEVCAYKANRISRVFEVDVMSFDEKAALYASLLPACVDRVSFVEHDITAASLVAALEVHGFDLALRTVIVIEGITHYLSPAICQTLLSRLASPKHHHTLVFEYSKSLDAMSDEIRPYALLAHGPIEKRYHAQGMTKYISAEVDAMFRALGGRLQHVFTIDEMEKLRTGANQFFPHANSGWAEVAVAHL